MGKRRKGYISERQYLTDYFQNTWWRHRISNFGYSSYGRVLSQLKEDDKVLDGLWSKSNEILSPQYIWY